MARARSKTELLNFGEKEYIQLLEYCNIFERGASLEDAIFDNRTIKDIVAHLHAWHLLSFTWYKEGMNELKPEIPAPGFTFKTTPELNEKLYQEYKDIEWKEVLVKFGKSHKKFMKIIEKYTEDELFTKKKYKWTGSTSMGSYFASGTSSHYAWANDLLKKHLRNVG